MFANTKPTKVVVLPAFPPIDKYVAFRRVMLDLGEKFHLVKAFCNVNQPTETQMADWQSRCSDGIEPYLIDVGAKKYHHLAPSAAQLEKMSSETRSGRIYNDLVELINKNNFTGFLKKQRHSVAKLVRETYQVMNSKDSSQELVFDRCMHVVNAYFFDQDKRSWKSLSEPRHAKLKQIWDGFGVQESEMGDFTLTRYFEHLFMSGRSEGEILERIGWWLDKAKRVVQRRQNAKKKDYRPLITRCVDGKSVGLFYVPDYFEAEVVSYQWIGSGKLAVGIIRNELGQVHILTSKAYKTINLKPVSQRFDEIEPGRWLFEERFGDGQVQMIMNGSRQFTGVPPTRQSNGQLLAQVANLMTFDKQ
jgi:hypothetical protein